METITEEELKWAAQIKDAARNDAELQSDNISDFEYLHHGIVAKDQVDLALKRLKRVQKFKEQYGIKLDGSYEDGLRDIKMFQDAHPGVILSLGVMPNESIVLCADCTALLTRKMKCDESYAILMRGMFYLIQASQSNLAAIRSGISVLSDGKNMGWRNFSIQVEERTSSLYSKAYPMRVNEIVMMNANTLMRLLYNLSKVFISKKLWSKHVFVGDMHEYLQASSYSQDVLPTEWNGSVDKDGCRRILSEKLRERYEIAANFKL